MSWGRRSQDPPVINPVNPDMLYQHWRYISPLLNTVLNKIDSGLDEETIVSQIKQNNYQLWSINNYEAIAITNIEDRPTYTVMNILFLSGSGLMHWLEALVAKLNDFARQYDAKYLEFYGREGWDRKAPNVGFYKKYTVMQRRVKDGR